MKTLSASCALLLGTALAAAGCTGSKQGDEPGSGAGGRAAGGSAGATTSGSSGKSSGTSGGTGGTNGGSSGGNGASGGGSNAGTGATAATGGSNASGGRGGSGGSSMNGSGSGGVSANAGAGAGSDTAGAAGDDCGGKPCNQAPDGLIDPARTTTWNPGILSDGLAHAALGADGIPVRTTVCAHPMPGDDVQAAIDACPEGQVVELAAAEYTTAKTLTLTKGVVLRGQGSSGAVAGGTTLVRTGGGAVLTIGTDADQACYASAFDTAQALAEDAQKETKTVRVAAGADAFKAGDLALLDEADDDAIDEGDCQYFKREDKRSLSERVEIASVDTASGTLTLTTPLHWTFRSSGAHDARIARLTQHVTRYAGIEGLYLQGGNNPGYDGQIAGGIDVSNAEYSWIKDVQTDGTIGGMHVVLSGTYRVVVRDSYFHHSANYGFGEDCYGIVIRCGSADNLIENNIVRYMNKPILFNVSGGGNVIGYNYADNSWATPPAWQEVNIDTHCAFPHMELMEGNYAPHMGATITHGTAGYLTYFRNYSSSQFAPPAVYGSTDEQTGNVTAIQFDQGDIDMTLVGNVLGSSADSDLGTAALSDRYLNDGTDGSSIIELGADYMSNVSFTTLWLHGNYDTVAKDVRWDPTIATHEFPASLYLAAKPAWWPAGSAWPWAGADLSPRVGTLPAKARADALAQ